MRFLVEKAYATKTLYTNSIGDFCFQNMKSSVGEFISKEINSGFFGNIIFKYCYMCYNYNRICKNKVK